MVNLTKAQQFKIIVLTSVYPLEHFKYYESRMAVDVCYTVTDLLKYGYLYFIDRPKKCLYASLYSTPLTISSVSKKYKAVLTF